MGGFGGRGAGPQRGLTHLGDVRAASEPPPKPDLSRFTRFFTPTRVRFRETPPAGRQRSGLEEGVGCRRHLGLSRLSPAPPLPSSDPSTAALPQNWGIKHPGNGHAASLTSLRDVFRRQHPPTHANRCHQPFSRCHTGETAAEKPPDRGALPTPGLNPPSKSLKPRPSPSVKTPTSHLGPNAGFQPHFRDHRRRGWHPLPPSGHLCPPGLAAPVTAPVAS